MKKIFCFFIIVGSIFCSFNCNCLAAYQSEGYEEIIINDSIFKKVKDFRHEGEFFTHPCDLGYKYISLKVKGVILSNEKNKRKKVDFIVEKLISLAQELEKNSWKCIDIIHKKKYRHKRNVRKYSDFMNAGSIIFYYEGNNLRVKLLIYDKKGNIFEEYIKRYFPKGWEKAFQEKIFQNIRDAGYTGIENGIYQ